MKENPWVKKTKGTGQHGRKAESKTAKRFGGRETPGSGNKTIKGDYHVNQWKVENKSTIHNSLKLDLDWLIKISQEALEVGMVPALSIQFVDGQGTPRKNGKWVMVSEEQYQRLLDLGEDV